MINYSPSFQIISQQLLGKQCRCHDGHRHKDVFTFNLTKKRLKDCYFW